MSDDQNLVRVGSFRFTPIGMSVVGKPSIEEWGQAGQALAVFAKGIQLCVGDWLRYGEAEFGEMAAQFIDEADWSEKTVRVYRWLSERVPEENRFPTLGVAHYMAAAKLDTPMQLEVLSAAAADGWTARDLRMRVAEIMAPPPTAEPQVTENMLPMTPDSFWVVVKVPDQESQHSLADKLQADGYECVQKNDLEI